MRERCKEKTGDFYPRPPRGGRPCRLVHLFRAASISIHALREEGDHSIRCRGNKPLDISIHALREEGDFIQTGIQYNAQLISIHALREEGDLATFSLTTIRFPFLSTPSARRATR